MKIRFSILCLLIALVFLTGCGQLFAHPTDSPFRLERTAKQSAFLTKQAMGPEEREATWFAILTAITPKVRPTDTPVPTITPPIPGSVRSICLQVEQAYGGPSGPFPPSFELAERLLVASGFTVMKPGENCHASLDIHLTLFPIGTKVGSRTCYLDAKATGSATLTQPGTPPHTVELAQTTVSSGFSIQFISECPSPSKAPVEGVANRAILQGLSETVGVITLYAAAKDENEAVRSSAVWDIYTLCEWGKILIPQQLFLDALADPAWGVRNSAIITLGQLGEAADFAFEDLAQLALYDPDAYIRSTALDYLDWIRRDSPELLPIYRQALNDPEERVQERAISGLGDLKSAATEAIPDLLAYFATHPDQSYDVVSALQNITGQTLDYELETWQTWWDEQN